MKIFITGSTGFIGKHVIRSLAKTNHDLMLLVRDENKINLEDFSPDQTVYLAKGDLANLSPWQRLLNEFEPDALIHLAWQDLPDYSLSACQQNLKMSENLFLAAVKARCKTILSAGSCWEYKKRKGRLNEEDQLDFSTPFSNAKNLLCMAGRKIAKKYDIKFYWPRFFFIYGPHQKKTSLIPHIINSFKNNITPDMKKPFNKNDFIYVEDAADAIVSIIENNPPRSIYNIGSGSSTAVAEIAKVVSRNMDRLFDVPNVPDTSENDNDDFYADLTAIKQDLDWKPAYTIEDGIKNTVDSFLGYQTALENK